MVAAAALAMCGLGCGSPVKDAASGGGCPSGTKALTAAELIGKPPPKGYVIDPGRKKALKLVAEQFKPKMGDSWRGYDAKVLVRRGELNGAAVIVINSDDKTNSRGGDLSRSFEAGAKQRGVETEKIVIGGQEGRMVPTIDGAFLAMAPAGECAVAVLVADQAALVRDAASVIPAP
jgi:hypothetical protein